MRRVITIDIETLPAEVDVESLAVATAEKPAEPNLKTALSGDFGRILCIGFADESRSGVVTEGVIGWDETTQSFQIDEKPILEEFWRRMREFRPNVDRIVGHNIFDFDLKFILKRSVIHGVRPTVDLSFARYRNQPIFDTMYEWERWSYGSKISLDKLAGVLELPSSKGKGVDGSNVYAVFMAGNHRAIRDYCADDVALTREIYRRLVFAECTPVGKTGAGYSEGLSALAG
jgi:DNA polymerase elongation subunit (family B)